jgi:energy-coupling factor transporter transmembrane protein EcfT
MAKIVIGLLILTVLALSIFFLLIIGLSIALLVFSKKGGKGQELSVGKGPT